MNGGYQTADVGTNIAVASAATASDLTVKNSAGTVPVYGYTLAGSPVTASMGTITPAPLSAAIIGNPTKVYDGTATATLTSANYQFSGFVTGQGATVNQPSSVSFGSAGAGAQTVSAAFANTNFVAASGTKLSNYSLPTAAVGPGTVLQAPLVITGVLATDKVYDGSTADPLDTSQAGIYGVIGGDAVALSSAAASGHFLSGNAGNGIAVTTGGFTLSGAQQADYQLVQPSGLTANITRAPLTVTGVLATNKVYDGNTSDVLNVIGAGLLGTVAGDAPTLVLSSAGAAGAFATKNVGSGLGVTASGFSISGASALNYVLAQPTGFVANITAAPLTITLTGNPTKPYNGTTTADLTSANFTISGFVGGEGATLPQTTLSQYASPNAGTQNVTATLTVPDFAAAGGTSMSNYSVPASVVGTGTITPAPLTGMIVGNPTKVYDSTTSAALTSANYTLSGFLTGQGATVNQTSGAYASPNAGVWQVTATLASGNYVPASGTLMSNYTLPTTLSGSGTITEAQLTGYVQAGIVGNPTKFYDGTTTATLNPGNFVLTGFTSGQGASVTQTVGQYASANAGIQSVTATLGSSDFTANSGTSLSNYHLPTMAYGSGTISPASLTVTIVNDPTRVYNGGTSLTLSSANYSIAGFVGGQGAQINPSALVNYASPNVGAESVTAQLTASAYTADSGTLMSNYVMASSASGSGHITPAPLYVTGLYATNKVYDTTNVDPLSTGAVALTGVVGSDAGNVSLMGSPWGTFGTIHVGNSLPVTISGYSIGGVASSNYTLQPTTGLTANITPAPLSVAGVTANSKPYDATNAATLNTASPTPVGLLGSDTVTLSALGAQGTFTSFNAGTGIRVNASGFSIAGGQSSDYVLNQPSGLTADITPAPITALITGNPTKVYDGSPSTTLTAANYTLLGFAGGQGASVPQSATAAYVAPDAGTNIGITSGLVLSDFVANSGTNLSNYQLPATGSGTGIITQAPLAAVIIGNPTKTYDHTDPASLTSANYQLTGFVGSQSASVTQSTGAYASVNAGAQSVSAALAPADFTAGSATNLNNYALPVAVSGTGTINRAPLTITGVTTTPQVYNGTTVDALSGATFTGTVYGGDTPALTNASTGTLGNSGNVGTDSVTTNMGLSGTGSANYVLIQPSGLTAVISPAPLSAASNVTKIYDGTSIASLGGANTTLTGFVAGQGATVNSGVTGTFAGANVGSGIAITGGALSTGDLTASSGTLLSNYTLPASDNGTGTISAATLTYTAVPSSFVYGTAPSGLSGAVSGFVNGESLATVTTGAATFSTTATSASNVGHYAIDGSGLAANNGNYIFTQAAANATALNITPAPLTVVNVATTSRLYDGTTIDALSGATLSGTLYNGNVLTLTNATTGTLGNSGNVGTDSVTTSMGLSGTGSGNYTLTQPTGLTAVISAVALTATSSATKSYDGTNIASLSGANTVLTGFVSGQGATVKSGVTGTFADANVGSGILITGGALTAADLTANSGTLLSNYTLPSSDNGSGSITRAVVNLSGARVYDAATDAAAVIFGSAGTVSGVNGENLVLSGSGTISNRNVGPRSLSSLGTLALSDGTGPASGLASNYTLIGGTDSVAVSQLGITVTGTAASRAYNGNTTATGVTLASTGVLAGDSLTFADTSALFNTKNAGTGKTVTISGISATGTGAANYSLNASTTTLADITPAVVSLTGARVYNADVDANATIFGSGGTISTGIGAETLNLSGAASLTSKNVGAEGLSSLGTLSLANGTGLAANYTLVGGADTVNVSKLAIAVAGVAANKVYDGNVNASATLSSSGVLSGDNVTFTDTSATFADKNVAIGKTVTISGITDGGTDSGNYTLTNASTTATASITPLGITVTGTAADKVYDGTTSAAVLTLASTGVLAGDSLTYHDTSAAFDTQNAGTGKTVTISGITATGTGAGNYSLNTTTTTTADVTRAVVNLTGTRVYDGNVDANADVFGTNGTVGTGIGGETVVLSGSGTLVTKNVGAQALSSAGSLTLGNGSGLASNYTLTGATGSVNISKLAISVAATASNKVYDGNTNAAVATLGSSGVFAGDSVTFADTSATFANKNAADGKTVTVSGITDAGTDAGNYTLTNTSATALANITPLGITVTGTALDKVYDGSTTATVGALGSNGVLSGDIVQFAGTSAAFVDKNVANGKGVTISGITSSGADSTNYAINNPSATALANITPLPITVGATGANRVYDGTVNDAVTLGSAGVVTGDSVVFSDASAIFADRNVGTGKAVSVSGISAAGTDSGNYLLNNTATATTADITPLAITVGGTAVNKVYDGNANATVAALGSSGVISGDNVTFAAGSAAFANKNAANGKAVTIAGITDAGTDAGNYTLNNTSATTTADITRLMIAVTGTGTNKVYDGSIADAVTLTGHGVLAGDVVSFSDASAVFGDKNVGTGKPVSISGITANGADGGNYAVNASTTAAADITPATLMETAKPVTVSLGQTPVLAGTVSGFVPGDTVGNATNGTLTWIMSAPAHPNVGSYAITGTGLTAANYIIEQAPANGEALSITTELIPQGDATERVYGLIGLPISPDTIATPYGVGTNSERSNNTGNAKRDPDPASSNRRLTDFKGRMGLTVVGAGVRLPDEDAT
jgi:hypothetical protein